MMKFTFKTDDKVFAKIKGYPHWPAKIVATNGRRYDVQFYGTGESGTVKDDSLFYYIKHKKRFMKALKRKDYLDAIREIETEIRIAGTDGNQVGDEVFQALEDGGDKGDFKAAKRKRVSEERPIKKIVLGEDGNSMVTVDRSKEIENDDVSKINELSKNQVSRSGRKIKVKRFSDDEDEDMEQKQKLIKKPKPIIAGDKKPEVNVNLEKETDVINEPLPNVDEESRELTPEKEIDQTVTSDTESLVEQEKEEYHLEDVNIIPREYLHAQLEYAMEVKKNENIYKKRKQDHRDVNDKSMVIAKLTDGKLVGIRYKTVEDSESEYDYVMDEEFYANDILNKVNQLESGAIDVDEIPNICETNLKFTETDVEDAITSKILEWKEEKVKWFRNELILINTDEYIVNCLGLDKADTKKALGHLNELLDLKIEPLMLKKHPHIVEVIKRLRKYVGNVAEWNLSEEASEIFEKDAKVIRNTAEAIYEKFKLLFGIPPEKPFWEEFNEVVDAFKNNTKNLNKNDTYILWQEPDSLNAFVDRAYEKRQEIVSNKLDSDVIKMDKENSSQVANSENKLDDTKESNL